MEKNINDNLSDSIKYIKKKINNIDINLYKTDKYTNVIFNIYFLQNFSSDWKYIHLITELITKCNNKFKTMDQQCQEMYRLYGAGIYASKFSNYKTMGIKFTVDCLNKDTVNDDTLYDECFDSLKTMIYDPHVYTNKDGRIEFDKKDFREAKNNGINEILNQTNDKKRYSYHRFLKKMSYNDDFPIAVTMSTSDLRKLKSVDAYDYYQNLINNSKIIISVIGDISEEEVYRLIDKLDLKSNNINLEFEDTTIKKDIVPRRITEKSKIKQAHLYLGYRTDCLYRDEFYPAYILFSIMFGELPSSTLFNKIREEQGLAYSVYSSVFPVRNFFYIYAGVDNSKVKLTIDSIKKELEKYRSGKILDDREEFEVLLEASKYELKNEYINSLDNQGSILLNGLKDSIVNRRMMKELYEDSLKVTLEDIVNVSNRLYLDTIYVLKGEKNE